MKVVSPRFLLLAKKKISMSRSCAGCNQRKTKNQYSSNQWGRGNGQSKCKKCVPSGGGMGGGGRGGGGVGGGGGGGGGQRQQCSFFLQGRCTKGNLCQYSHGGGGGNSTAAAASTEPSPQIKASRALLAADTMVLMNKLWSVLDFKSQQKLTREDFALNPQTQQAWALLQQGGFDKGSGAIESFDFMDAFITLAVAQPVNLPAAPTQVTTGDLLIEFERNLNSNIKTFLEQFVTRLRQLQWPNI